MHFEASLCSQGAIRSRGARPLYGGILIAALLLVADAVAQRQTGAPAGVPVPPPPAISSMPPDSSVPKTEAFRVRLIDGRNGTPVAGAHVRLWYDEPAGEGYTVVTDADGVALMPAPIGQPIRILADITGQTDCRRQQRYSPKPAYVLADIAAKGAAADNTCGSVASRTSPGELLLFARPARWYEKLNRNADTNIP